MGGEWVTDAAQQASQPQGMAVKTSPTDKPGAN